MVKQNKGKPIEEFIQSAKAPLEHLFNNHTYYKVEWCDRLKSQLAGKPYNYPKIFCTCSTIDGEKTYQDTLVVIKKYESDFLRQSMHPFTT